jgi:hypothetical protein
MKDFKRDYDIFLHMLDERIKFASSSQTESAYRIVRSYFVRTFEKYKFDDDLVDYPFNPELDKD